MWTALFSFVFLNKIARYCNNNQHIHSPSFLRVHYDEVPLSDAYIMRKSIAHVIEDSWYNINDILPKQTIDIIQEELKTIISLIVLASVKKSSTMGADYRKSIELMFTEADRNSDGQLTFSEWYNWLSQANTSQDRLPSASYSSNEGALLAIASSLKEVLTFAVSVLKTASKLSIETSVLIGAFVAGAVSMNQYVDSQLCRSIIARLSPTVREIVSLAITLESFKISLAPNKVAPSQSSGGTVWFSSSAAADEEKNSRYLPVIWTSMPTSQRDWQPIESMEPSRSMILANTDLRQKPLAAAGMSASLYIDCGLPEIVDRRASGSRNLYDEYSATYEQTFSIDYEEIEFAPAETSTFLEQRQAEVVVDSVTDNLSLLFQKANSISEELSVLRLVLRDLDDDHAKLVRNMLLERGEGRTDVWGVALSLRAARLSRTSILPAARQQALALDTLQVWAPLTFQLGVHSELSELELHSYILLYPRSFGSFVSWYQGFKPAAKTLLNQFRLELEGRFSNDKQLVSLCDSVTVQTRLKSPTSAFKKMVKSAKVKDQIFDLMGLRVILGERTEAQDWMAEKAVWMTLSHLEAMPGWRLLSHRTKNYIQQPKPSGYRSLHLVVLHEQTNWQIEIQVRTSKMHLDAETGLASHSAYKALALPPAKLEGTTDP